MIKIYSGGGKSWKIVGKQRRFRWTGFLKKHTSSEGINQECEIQGEILYQFLTLLIEI